MDDFERFNVKSFVSRLLGMGDINGLLEIFQDTKILDETKNAGELGVLLFSCRFLNVFLIFQQLSTRRSLRAAVTSPLGIWPSSLTIC